MQLLKANTAIDVLIGPFVDEDDGKTAETGLTIAQADVRLSKNGQNMAQKNDNTTCVHDELGYYNCELDSTDTNTEGCLVLTVHESGALPVRHEYMVMAEAAYDSMFTAKDTGYMDVNIKAISEDTTAADTLETFVEITNLTSMTLDASGHVECNVVEIEGADPTDTIRDSVVDDATRIDASSVNAIEAKVDTVDTNVDAILVDTGTTLPATLSTIDGIVDDILVDTAEIGAAGAGLTEAGGTGDQFTALPWNASWDAEVQSECDDALKALNLDHLMLTGDATLTNIVADNTALAHLMATGADISDFSNTTDSLESIRDHIGDGTNLTEAGGTGDQLTAVPWNSDWDSEVQSEVQDAIEDNNLDHWMKVATSDRDTLPEVVDDTVLANILTKTDGDTSDYDHATDSLEAVRDNQAGADAGAIADAVLDEALSGHTSAGTLGKAIADIEADTNELQADDTPGALSTIEGKIDTIDTNVDAILVDTGTTLDGKLNTIDGNVDSILVDTAEIGAAGAGLTAVPWNSNWDAEVQSEVQDALEANNLDHLLKVADSDDVTDNSVIAKMAASDGDWSGFSAASDSLEAIRDRGDAAWAGEGAGAITFTYTLTNSQGGAPIADANVWVTSDAAGSNVLASGRTDQNGEVVFYLDAGTVYVWRQKSGWDFDNPDTETVS